MYIDKVYPKVYVTVFNKYYRKNRKITFDV